ncbi:MAG TPA: pyridoxamine 5'-phosphate oxidase family protein [Magnetospirillum sp.]|nr:pyridoxamine 5'-phosphate oxidase family protein [Magnetospirillum sp.]
MAHDDDQLPADNRLALRRVARACRKAGLATLMEGAPYASLVTVAFDMDLTPILLLSGLSDHTRNLMADGRASLLLDGTDGLANPQTGPRVTLSGLARRSDDPRLKARFLARHPGAALYAGFGDFAIWTIQPERVHFVGGFGRAVWFDYPFGLDLSAIEALKAVEADWLAEVNIDFAGRLGDGWRLAALDPDGVDLMKGEDMRRLAFPSSVVDAPSARALLAEMLKGPTTLE